MRRRQKGSTIERWELLFVDVEKEHFNGIPGDDEGHYVELPDEANACGKVGRLKRWLYGVRQAASAWEQDYASTAFWNEERQITLRHGDDFTASG